MQEKLSKELINAVIQARKTREQFISEITKYCAVDDEKELTKEDIEEIEKYAFITELLTSLVKTKDLAIISDELQIGDVNQILEILSAFGFPEEFLDELKNQ